MPEIERESLSKYRFEEAECALKDAKQLLSTGSFKGSNNRAYYSIYHAMRAVIALDAVEFKRHSGNITYFQKEYIKTGIFSPDSSKIIQTASEIRNASDYDDFYIAVKEDSVQQVENAEIFLN